MAKKAKQDDEIIVHNIFADGHTEDDITGHVIPLNAQTLPAYKIIGQVALRVMRESAKQGV